MMLNFLKSLFGGRVYGMGSLPSPADPRRINITSVQASISIPDIHINDVSMFGINDQGSTYSCVGQAMAKLGEFYIYKKTGKIVRFDPISLYNECKKEDGIPYLQGTYASVGAKIVVRDGIDQYNMNSNDKFANGYAYIPVDFEAICQAIYQNGVLAIGMQIDRNWFSGIIGKALQYIGGHETLLNGYNKEIKCVYGVNSWGVGWIGRIAGLLDSRVKSGCYNAKFDDIRGAIIDIIAFLPIPKEIIDDIKNTGYKFTTTMKIGSEGYEVKKLQERLGLKTDGIFGSHTKASVVTYQLNNGLVGDGIVGPKMRAKLNIGTGSLLSQWAQAIKEHEGYFPGSRSYRNNSPANFKLASNKLTEYMKKLGAIDIDPQNFVKFPDIETGTKALETFLKDAATNKLSRYRETMTISEFIHVYAPMSENDTERYISQMTKKLGVDRSLPIKELI